MATDEKPKEAPDNADEDAYGSPAYSALEGGGFGFTRALYGGSARETEASAADRSFAGSQDDRLAELRARLDADPTLDTDGIDVVFRDGALHLRGQVADERTWYAVVNMASTFAPRVVDHLQVASR